MALYAKCIQDLLQRCSEAHTVYASRNKPTLKPMLAICDRMRNPQNHYKCIHIAGTNGKGSVSTKLAASLSFCGYRVGLFTSPHISSMRERICVNGKMISKGDFVNDFNKIIHYENDINYKLTYFELLNAMAFYHFKRIGVDFAIIEVGVGGTWDSTNVISQPLLSIIVSISLDHTKLLGNTIDQIATDKCGIIKKTRPCIIGPTVPYKIAKEKCDKMESILYQMNIDDDGDGNANNNGDQVQGGSFDTYDEHNTNLAKYALQILNNKYFILPKNVNELNKTLQVRPHCRMESVKINLHKLFKTLFHSKSSSSSHLHSSQSLITQKDRKWLKKYMSTEIDYEKYKNCINPIECIFDVAHNPEAFKQLFKSLTKKYSPLQYSYRVILGINPNKKLKDCCQVVTEYADSVHLVISSVKNHGAGTEKLEKILIEHCKYDKNKISTTGNGNVFQEIIYALNQCWIHNNSRKELNTMALHSSQSDDISSTNSSEKEQKQQKLTTPANASAKMKRDSSYKYKTEILVITGSFYIMSDARKSLGLRYDDDNQDLKQYQQRLRKNSD